MFSRVVNDVSATLLRPNHRAAQRQLIGLTGKLPFLGADLWTAFELSWLNPRGKPQVALAHFSVPCESVNLIESRSLTRYLGSFSNTQFADATEVQQRLRADLTEAAWDHFFAFYQDTGNRKWGRPYLNRAFFSLLSEAMADRVLLMFAYDGDTPVAGTLSLVGRDRLYGRYWGATREVPFLHFELCYYQAIDFAIAHRLSVVEAGAQGEHKLARGYAPTTTRSVHWIGHPGLRDAVSRFLAEERRSVEHEQQALARYTPFRHGEPPT